MIFKGSKIHSFDEILKFPFPLSCKNLKTIVCPSWKLHKLFYHNIRTYICMGDFLVFLKIRFVLLKAKLWNFIITDQSTSNMCVNTKNSSLNSCGLKSILLASLWIGTTLTGQNTIEGSWCIGPIEASIVVSLESVNCVNKIDS